LYFSENQCDTGVEVSSVKENWSIVSKSTVNTL